MKIQVINNSQHQLPVYATEGSAGLDLKASFTILDNNFKGDNFELHDKHDEQFIILNPLGRILIPTDLYVAIPEGFELQIRSRSGNAIKSGIFILNTPGTIDSDYRGNIGLIVANFSETPFIIRNGDKLAQAILTNYEKIEWKLVDTLPETKRGEGGYGHSGK